MATTGVDFVLIKKPTTPQLSGSAVLATPFVQALDHQSALTIAGRVPGGAANAQLGSNNGNYLSVLSDKAFAKNGAFHVTCSGTTPVSIDLTNLVTGATSQAGDATFASWNHIQITSCGAAAATLGPGASNGNAILNGTTPTIPVPLNGVETLTNVAGFTVDSTHKILTLTPTAGGDFLVTVGGA
jgi:hypothetical protein